MAIDGHLNVGLGDIENSELRLLQQRHCDYCHDIALEYFTIKNKAKHHHTCIPLETATLWYENLLYSWVSMVVS